MKFWVKITVCMLCLMALIFGIGGSAIIDLSFNNLLKTEVENVKTSYKRLMSTIHVMHGTNEWGKVDELTELISTLDKNNVADFEYIRVWFEDEVVYTSIGSNTAFLYVPDETDSERSVINIYKSKLDEYLIQVSGKVTVGQNILRIDAVKNISYIYEMRTNQTEIYRMVFVIMVVLCLILCPLISVYLTKPLSRLSRNAKEIASGKFSSRSKINSEDEIGKLSREFNNMAEHIESDIKEMEDMLKAREEFMGSFAHEMKTPMTSIIGYADLIRSGVLSDEEKAQAANYIFSEGKRLEKLSLTLLDILVLGNEEPNMILCSPSDLAASMVKNLKPIYKKENIDVYFKGEKGKCYLDSVLISTLLINLIDNARKAFENGGIILVMVVMDENGADIVVQDNGIGIPEEALSRLTESFYRVDKSRSRQRGGSGLGLSLCAKIAELHGGEIKFYSREGKGTKVIVSIRKGRGETSDEKE